MSAISPKTPGPTPDAERHEWQGQKWEYLGIRIAGMIPLRIDVPDVKYMNNPDLFDLYESDLLEIAKGLKDKKIGNGKTIRETDLLGLLGNNGWELVAVTSDEYGKTGNYYFKRPKVSP